MAFTAKTIHAQRQIDYGNKNEHDTLVLMISKTDKYVGQLTGNLDIRNAVVFLQKKIVEEDSLDKTKWLKSNMEDYPSLKMPLPKLFLDANQLKRYVSSQMKWLLNPLGLKLGQGIFPSWQYRLDRALLLHSGGLLDDMADTEVSPPCSSSGTTWPRCPASPMDTWEG